MSPNAAFPEFSKISSAFLNHWQTSTWLIDRVHTNRSNTVNLVISTRTETFFCGRELALTYCNNMLFYLFRDSFPCLVHDILGNFPEFVMI